MAERRERLILGDCLEVMGDIDSGSIDLILADLPYGITACRWDSVIPLKPLWDHYRRLLKPNGSVILMASQPFTSFLVMSNLEWFKYCLVWQKNRLTNFFNTKFQPGKSHEDIVVFSPLAASFSTKGNMTYNPQLSPGPSWKKRDLEEVGDYKHCHEYHQPKRARTRISNGGRLPCSVLKFDCEFGNHPTQKPVNLMIYLIITYSNEGDMVLDNAMGSGTTGVACIKSGRRFIGIDKDPEFFAIAERRIEDVRTPLLEMMGT